MYIQSLTTKPWKSSLKKEVASGYDPTCGAGQTHLLLQNAVEEEAVFTAIRLVHPLVAEKADGGLTRKLACAWGALACT